MATDRTSSLPQRAGTQASGGGAGLVNPQGRHVPVPVLRVRLWELLDGQCDVEALAQALAWPAERVWSELDALGDDGLLQRRAAPPAGGAGLSRRRMLRSSLPALALSVPGFAIADTVEQSWKAAEEESKIGEPSGKTAAAEQTQKQAAQPAQQEQQAKMAEFQNKQSSEQGNKQQEQQAKMAELQNKQSSEQGNKQQQEQSLKSQEIAIKVGQGGGGSNAVPEPSTLALIGIAGVGAYLQRHLRARAAAERPASKPPAEQD